MTWRLTRLATGLVGTVLTVLLLVGPPWLLTTFVGSPVPSSWPDLDLLRSIATVGVTDTFVITTLAVIVWSAWIQLAIAIVIETFSAIRRRPPVRLPLIPGTQPLAARLVAATLLLVTVLQPRPLAAAAPLDLAVAAAPHAVIDDEQHPVPQLQEARSAPQISTQTIVAGDRDSWWSLAETHLGDGLRWREIRDLNADRTLADGSTIRPNTEHVQPGWSLLVPAKNGSDTEQPTDSTSAVDDTDPADAAAVDNWEVEQGDHFWHIARTTLEQAWDRTPTDEEIDPYWRDLIDTNRDRLAPPGDPDLIHPGQQFELPAVPPDPRPSIPAQDMRPDVPPAPLDAPEPHTGPPATADEAEASSNATDAEPPAAAADTAGDSWHHSLTTPPESQAADVGELSAEVSPELVEDDQPRTRWSVPAGMAPGIVATMLMAAGISALLARRRRVALQQRSEGFRLPTLAPDVDKAAAQLIVAAPPDEVLTELVDLLCSVPAEVEPVLVLAHDDGAVSLVFDNQPDVVPPAPWTRDGRPAGEPTRWTAHLGERGERRSFGIPLLVTLGRLNTSTLLANLGAMRALRVEGHPTEVQTRLRAFTVELATSRTAGPVEVTVAGDDLFGDLDQVRVIDDPTVELAAAMAEVEQGVIVDDRVPRLIVTHADTPSIDVPAELAPLCATVSGGQLAGAWTFSVAGDHGWLHLPDGTKQRVTLPELEPALIARMLESVAAEPSIEPSSPERESPDVIDVREMAPNDEEDTTVAEAWCEVGLLGPFTVTKGGEVITGFTSITRQVLAYLVTHRENATTGRLDDAVWAGQAAPGGRQRVRSALARLRNQLGAGPDGEPLLPPRHAGDDKIVLPPTIGTDLDRAFRYLAEARQLDDAPRAELLLRAVRLVRGEPFEDLPVSWAVDVQQRAIAELQDAAVEAAALLRAAGRYDDAEAAVRQGLLLCDPCELLYVEWARLEDARHRPDQIRQIWRRLKQRYADDADEIMGVAGSPTIETELAFTELTQRS